MYLCYVDESGVPNIPGNTSHFVLAGLSVPVWHWRACDRDIGNVKRSFGLADAEIHTAWIRRSYRMQSKVTDFERLNWNDRRYEVTKLRTAELLRLQQAGNPKRYRQAAKNFRKTESYIHLTRDERETLMMRLAHVVGGWGFARLFAECIDKVHFDPVRAPSPVDEQALEQVVSRFEQYLEMTRGGADERDYGVLIHDNNDTVARKHTALMQSFHDKGTLWTEVENIIETPLYVDSELTSMVQIADLCAYALRRYLENDETELFEKIFERADRRGDVAVGVRHFTDDSCMCEICQAHRQA